MQEFEKDNWNLRILLLDVIDLNHIGNIPCSHCDTKLFHMYFLKKRL